MAKTTRNKSRKKKNQNSIFALGFWWIDRLNHSQNSLDNKEIKVDKK